MGGCGEGNLDEIGALIIALVNVVGGGGVANVGRSKSYTGGGEGGFSAAKKLQIANKINTNEISTLKQGVTLYELQQLSRITKY